jgi:hypothetical protein
MAACLQLRFVIAGAAAAAVARAAIEALNVLSRRSAQLSLVSGVPLKTTSVETSKAVKKTISL